jgi:hypothetical protein
MKRMLWYDRETGELIHSHYEVRAIERPDAEAQLSAPATTDLDENLAELVSRGLDLDRLGSTTAGVTPQSSRSIRRWVDVTSGRLRSQRIELADNPESTQED